MSKARTVEILLDGVAAAWMASCVGAALMMAAPTLGFAKPLPMATACAAAAALVAYRLLATLRGPQHRLPEFELLPLATIEPDRVEAVAEELLLTSDMVRGSREELLLTPAMALLTTELLLTRGQMLANPSIEPSEPLILDDVLAELRPGSRVVQLFDPERMPTAGELKSRIDRHLSRPDRDAPARQEPDASQALYDALADLRRSLA